MKAASRKPRAADRLPGDGRSTEPEPGWKGESYRELFQNPRPPAAPATLDLTLVEYYAAAGLMGILASQRSEPNKEWLKQWAFDIGAEMAAEAKRRRRKP